MNGEPLPFWFGVVVGMVGPLAIGVLVYVGGKGCIAFREWIERKLVARRIAAECSRAPERVR